MADIDGGFGGQSFGRQAAQRRRLVRLGPHKEEGAAHVRAASPATISPAARPNIAKAITREGAEVAFGAALSTRIQEYERGCAQAVEFKLAYFANNLEKKLCRHAEDATSVAAAISAVVAEEVPRTTAELVRASSKGQDHATARGRALVSQLVAAALDETADVWRIRRRAAVRVSETDPELLADLFNKIDIDGSGELERGEIAQMSAELGRPLSDKELDAAMRSMDADGSGEVDLHEFIAWFERMKAAGEMPSWGAALGELQAKMRAEKEAEIRAELMAGQTAGAEAVQRMEGELAAAQAKRAADEANQSDAEAAADAERIAGMAEQAEDSAEAAQLRKKMLAVSRELAAVDHEIRDQRSKLQGCEARLSLLRTQEAEAEKAAAQGFATAAAREMQGREAALRRGRGRRAAGALPGDGIATEEPAVGESQSDRELRELVADIGGYEEEEDTQTRVKLDNIEMRIHVSRDHARRLLDEAGGHAGRAILIIQPILQRNDPHGLADLFAQIDIDGSGTLEREEIRQMSKELGNDLTERELDLAMQTMDEDQSVTRKIRGCIHFLSPHSSNRGWPTGWHRPGGVLRLVHRDESERSDAVVGGGDCGHARTAEAAERGPQARQASDCRCRRPEPGSGDVHARQVRRRRGK